MDIRSIGGLKQASPALPDGAVRQTPARPAAGAETVNAAPPPPAAPSAERLTEALKSINKTLQAMSPGVEFTMDEESHRTVVKIIDQQNKQVIRQIPSEEALAISKALDRLQGLLIHQTA